MSSLEVIGLFFVIFATGLVVAISLLAIAIASAVVYRWAKRGYAIEKAELEAAERNPQALPGAIQVVHT